MVISGLNLSFDYLPLVNEEGSVGRSIDTKVDLKVVSKLVFLPTNKDVIVALDGDVCGLQRQTYAS